MRKVISFLLFIFPGFVSAQVVINEIAWMGTENSANDEWIELKNTGNKDINLDGWILEAEDGSPKIELSGSIKSNNFFLLERSDDTSVPNVLADQIYTGALSNSGEILILKDNLQNEIDRVDGSDNWKNLAGDKDFKYTAQIINGLWETATSTPKSENNIQKISTNTEKENKDNNTNNKKNNTTVNYSIDNNPTIKADAGENIVAQVNQNIFFDGSGSEGDNTSFSWNMGNGELIEGEKFLYKYKFPGKYLVTLFLTKGSEKSISQIDVTIYPENIYISEFFNGENGDDWIEIYNNTDNFVNLSNWSINSKNKSFVFPEGSFISPYGYLVFSSDVLGGDFLEKEGDIKLLYPNGQASDIVEYKFIGEYISASRKNKEEFIWTKNKTPGQANVIIFSDVDSMENKLNKTSLEVEYKNSVSRNLIKENKAFFIKLKGQKSFLISPARAKVLEESSDKFNNVDIGDKFNNSNNISANISFLASREIFFVIFFITIILISFWFGRKFK